MSHDLPHYLVIDRRLLGTPALADGNDNMGQIVLRGRYSHCSYYKSLLWSTFCRPLGAPWWPGAPSSWLPCLFTSCACLTTLLSPNPHLSDYSPAIKPPDPVFTPLLILSKDPLIDSQCHSVSSCRRWVPLAHFPVTPSAYMLQQEEGLLGQGQVPPQRPRSPVTRRQ